MNLAPPQHLGPLAAIAPYVLAETEELARRFQSADPFRHLVIDNFFIPEVAEELLRTFPAFERGNAHNEAGELGGKSTIERIRDLGAPWRALDDMIRSPPFLDLVSRLTGISDLLYDPHYFGGGTHENRHGQDLDPHVDFNRHPIENWHRRLNLIVYLNHGWQASWGGTLDLHSDARVPTDRIKHVVPIFNRCVIFETTEWSWHGFDRITLPPDAQNRSRKSIALYFYTRERPAEELADTHSTIYVDRTLPDRFAVGHTLDETDVLELHTHIARRDQHIQRLYRDITRLTAETERLQNAIYAGALGRLRYLLRHARQQLTKSR